MDRRRQGSETNIFLETHPNYFMDVPWHRDRFVGSSKFSAKYFFIVDAGDQDRARDTIPACFSWSGVVAAVGHAYSELARS